MARNRRTKTGKPNNPTRQDMMSEYNDDQLDDNVAWDGRNIVDPIQAYPNTGPKQRDSVSQKPIPKKDINEFIQRQSSVKDVVDMKSMQDKASQAQEKANNVNKNIKEMSKLSDERDSTLTAQVDTIKKKSEDKKKSLSAMEAELGKTNRDIREALSRHKEHVKEYSTLRATRAAEVRPLMEIYKSELKRDDLSADERISVQSDFDQVEDSLVRNLTDEKMVKADAAKEQENIADLRLKKLHQQDVIGAAKKEDDKKNRLRKDADNLTPESVRRGLMAGRPETIDLESRKAAAGIRRAGGSKDEQVTVAAATKEFHELVAALKQTKLALVDVNEGSAEQAILLSELSNQEASVIKVLGTIEGIKGGIDRRKFDKEDAEDRWKSSKISKTLGVVGSGLNVAGSMSSEMGAILGQYGNLPENRYIAEEEKKSAKLRLKGAEADVYRNAGRDASAYLKTAKGAESFGIESAFAKDGGVTKTIKALGDDFKSTKEGMGHLVGTLQMVGSVLDTTGNVTTALNGLNVAAATTAGAKGVINAARIASGTDLLTGGDQAGMVKGAFDAMAPFMGATGGDFSKSAGNVMSRAKKTMQEQFETAGIQAQQGQMGNIGERADLMAPMLQTYFNMQPSMLQSYRGRVSTHDERRDQERNLGVFSTNADLRDRGFSPNQIVTAEAQASQGMGRFGANQGSERVSSMAMRAEAAGMGGTSQNIQAMMKMLGTGTKDPELVFKKAFETALKAGLNGSRDFQLLLQATQSSAESSLNYEASLELITRGLGTGRSDDVRNAKALADSMGDRTGGNSGRIEDIMMWGPEQDFEKKFSEEAKRLGINFSKADRSQITATHGLESEQLRNTAQMEAMETQNNKKIRESIEAKEGKGVYSKYAEAKENKAIFGRAAYLTQTEESIKADELFSGKGEKKTDALTYFQDKNKGKDRAKDALANLYRQVAYAGNDTKKRQSALAEVQLAGNLFKEKGILTDEEVREKIPMSEKIKPKIGKEVEEGGKSAGTLAEEQGIYNAKVEFSNLAIATSNLKGGFEGLAKTLQGMSDSDVYKNIMADLTKQVKDTNTVEINPNDKIIPLREMGKSTKTPTGGEEYGSHFGEIDKIAFGDPNKKSLIGQGLDYLFPEDAKEKAAAKKISNISDGSSVKQAEFVGTDSQSKKLDKILTSFESGKLIINNVTELTISTVNKIKGVILDDGAKSAAKEIGSAIISGAEERLGKGSQNSNSTSGGSGGKPAVDPLISQ